MDLAGFRVAQLAVVLMLGGALLAAPDVASAHPVSGGEDLVLPDSLPVDDPLAETVSDNFELVGHEPLFNRGMNAALAVHDGYAYVGNRTDGQPYRQNPEVLVVDVQDPSAPQVAGRIGRPHAANLGESSRELRVWPQQDLLIVLNHGCSSLIHACATGEFTVRSTYRFFDISGDNAADPQHVATYEPSISRAQVPHEFFLWVDPDRPRERALMFHTTVTNSQSAPSMLVTDLSNYADGEFPETEWVADFPAGETEDGESENRALHSMTVSNDGTRTYLAFLGAGFLVLDTSEVAEGVEDAEITYATPPENRVNWTNPGAHSAHKVFGQDVALITDEVYGEALSALGHGCPWGWVRLIDIADEAEPAIIGEYKVEENDPDFCDTPEGRNPANTASKSYSSHNPTLTPNLAFVTWHSSGLEVFSIDDPETPERMGKFKPEPLAFVETEDPALSMGLDKVVMWSFPVISDGLIYVIDLRNGLYILEYTGEHADEVAEVDFLEGNSNLGDALRFEPTGDEPGAQGRNNRSERADNPPDPAPGRPAEDPGGSGLLAAVLVPVIGLTWRWNRIRRRGLTPR